MKLIVPKGGQVPEHLSNEVIPVELFDDTKIIVIDQYPVTLGIVTKIMSEPTKYGVIDLYNCRNFWPTSICPTAIEVMNIFYQCKIYQFDSRREFIRWLARREGIQTANESDT